MGYIVKLNKDKDIIDLCYAVKDVGKVILTEDAVIRKALDYIENEIKYIPLTGWKIRLLELKDILTGEVNQ